MGRTKTYADPPWIFKGRALYQLHLVKVQEAKKYIPRDLDVVSLFGYTLGGFYLARYDDTPAGSFDECVALAGIVWNKPTSCAWAARVYVNNREARDHGRQHVGLPSRVCRFHELPGSATSTWWDQPFARRPHVEDNAAAGESASEGGVPESSAGGAVVLQNVEKRQSWRPWRQSVRNEGLKAPVCAFSGFPSAFGRHGPKIKLSLPSYSGRTPDSPGMLRYACHLRTNVRLVTPIGVSCSGDADHSENLAGILGGRPVLALAFDNMEMVVQKPISVVGRTVSRDDEWELADAKAVPRLLAA